MNFDELTNKKNLLDKLRPLPAVLSDNLSDWFRVELTYNSNAIEGNTLTRRETAMVVEKGLTIGGKTLREHLEAANHARALDWVSRRAESGKPRIGEKDVLHIHGIIMKGIDDSNAGLYRNVPVRIAGSPVVLPNPRKVPDLMREFFKWLKVEKSLHPVALASEAHYRLVTIHPFADGNGRTARLLMTLVLLSGGYPPAIIRKRDRAAYIGALEKAQLGGSKDDYENLIFKAADRSLDTLLNAAQGETAAPKKPGKLLKIGELAARTGETVPTIRHWTKEGLLKPAGVTQSGYQLYGFDCVDRVKEIRRLQKERWAIRDIKGML